MAIKTNPRNIVEVPLTHTITVNGKTITTKMDNVVYQLLSDLREQTLQLRQRLANPDAPTNFKATGQSLSNLLQWTRSADADYYEILKAFTPSTSDAHLQIIDVGNSASWTDSIGSSGIKAFYWVRARKTTGASSLTIGPVAATTLPATAGTAQPTPPPASNILVIDRITGRLIPYELAGGRSYRQ